MKDFYDFASASPILTAFLAFIFVNMVIGVANAFGRKRDK